MSKRKPKPANSRPEVPPEVPQAGACSKCGELDSSPVGEPTEQAYRGLTPAGEEYSTIIRQRVRCDDCGQVRIERSYA